jgi:hypothetical protein
MDEENRALPAIGSEGQFLSSRVGVTLGERRCPSCNSVVYSRRHSRCGVCERELPESCQFSRAEVERLEALLEAERRRHRAWLSRYALKLG